MNYRTILSFIAVLCISTQAYAEYTGIVPVPVFTDAGIQAEASYDPSTGHYTYAYTVSNPASNTDEIRIFYIDISKPKNSITLGSEGLTIPSGVSTFTFDEEASSASLTPLVPVGQRLTASIGWMGGLGGKYARFASRNFDPHILPGQTVGGYEIYSPGPPGIRDVKIKPTWSLVADDSAPLDVNLGAINAQIQEQLTVRKKTIGPTAPPGSTGLNFHKLREMIGGYIDESVTLGWLTDATLADSLRAKLLSVKEFMDADDGTQAKTALGEFMTLLDNATASQRTSEAYGLLYFNAKYLKDRLPDTVIPPVTLFDLSPYEGEQTLGTTHTLTAMLTSDGEPMYCMPVSLEIISGPNAGLILPEGLPGFPTCTPPDWAPSGGNFLYTDGNGQSIFSYTSKLQGTDEIVAYVYGEAGPWYSSEPVEVIWSGGPDLVIETLFPPLTKTMGGVEKQIYIKEITKNIGNTAAGLSITRYYLSEDEEIDPATDRLLGERQIEPLEPEMSSNEGNVMVTIPSDLAEGIYYLWGCVDADDGVLELDEQNNCLKNQVITEVYVIRVLPTNQPPDCSQAFPSVASLWPPNHELFPVSVMGITDPDDDALTLTVTAITQDEPVNGLGDGDTSPDGFGVGLSKAELRAERSGTGNGRVYAVRFAAADGNGGQCAGSVNVTVPHDKGKGATAIDDGQAYDSTQP